MNIFSRGGIKMKYLWDKMTDEQKENAIKEEMWFVTHIGTTKDDLLNMVRWLWDKVDKKEN
jgi:hypothetical protein